MHEIKYGIALNYVIIATPSHNLFPPLSSLSLEFHNVQHPTANKINHQPITNNKKPATNNQQPTANNQQPTANNQQPTTNNPHPTANNQQPTTNNQQPTTDN
jgi:hypothetical protein